MKLLKNIKYNLAIGDWEKAIEFKSDHSNEMKVNYLESKKKLSAIKKLNDRTKKYI